MKVKNVTLKGWVNNSNFLFSQNSQNDIFAKNFENFVAQKLKGYKRLSKWQTLRGKNASEKIVIKGNYWRGSWNDPTKEVVAVFYK